MLEGKTESRQNWKLFDKLLEGIFTNENKYFIDYPINME